MNKRIIGIDVARALAVIGMIIVNFKIVFGEHGEGWMKEMSGFLSGKAAATFVVLAGIGMALMTNKSMREGDISLKNTHHKSLLRRAIFLFVVGLSYSWIWPADILHFYGIYMLISLVLIGKKPSYSLVGAIIFILIYPLLIILFSYETGWDFSSLHYLDFWTVKGFIRNLLFNGFHPVIPWAAFMFFGIWFGRQNLNDNSFIIKAFFISTVGFIIIQLLSAGMVNWASGVFIPNFEEANALFGTEPMPPMPFYMLNGILFSVMIVSVCIIIGKRFSQNKLILALKNTGKLALTFYVAHVVIGMGLVEELFETELGDFSIQFSVLYALGFSAVCIVFAQIWLKYKKSGPLEWLMRKLTG